jgi:NitT/TauT family transport system substrate-binding protein
MTMRLSLYENYRFLLYAPFYAAHAIGAFEAEGLEVDLSPSPGAGKAEEAQIAGAVDVIWAGPMRVIKHHDEHPDSPLVCFAEVVARAPFSIVGRAANPAFRLTDLAGIRFASVSEVPTPGCVCSMICARRESTPVASAGSATAAWPTISQHCSTAVGRTAPETYVSTLSRRPLMLRPGDLRRRSGPSTDRLATKASPQGMSAAVACRTQAGCLWPPERLFRFEECVLPRDASFSR